MKQQMMILSVVLLFLVSCAQSPLSSIVDDQARVGEVISFKGSGMAISKGLSREVALGDYLYEGDTVKTDENTRMKIRMVDGAELILGDRTTLIISEYRLDQASEAGNVTLEFKKGFFHSRSGKIARQHPKRFRLKTAFAVVGVKGTEFWGGFWDGGKFEVALLDGTGIIISNPAGSVEIDTIGWGTTLVSDTIAPTTPKLWGDAKIKRAVETVALGQ